MIVMAKFNLVNARKSCKILIASYVHFITIDKIIEQSITYYMLVSHVI